MTKPPEQSPRRRLHFQPSLQPPLHRFNSFFRPEQPRQQAAKDNAGFSPFLLLSRSQASLPRCQPFILRVTPEDPVERLILERIALQDLFVAIPDLPILRGTQSSLRRDIPFRRQKKQ